MAIAYTPYVFCALIVAIYQLLTGKRRERIKKAKRILMFSLLPICLMNTWGFYHASDLGACMGYG